MRDHRRYAAISFDVGYTLIQPIREASVVVAGLLAEQGIDATPEALDAAYRRAERLFMEDYLRPLGDTWEADERIERFYVRYYAQLLADLGVPNPDGAHGPTIIRRYLAPDNWTPYPNVLDTLATLHAAGYRMGIASDWGSALTRILHALGLSRYLDWAIVSGAIGAAKPSPQFYRLVVQRAGVPASQIVHVGDSYYADVRGARTVGMDAVLIDWRRRPLPPLDVPLIHDLAELPALVASAPAFANRSGTGES
jgi:putative hydrolase of the HAD superfamily